MTTVEWCEEVVMTTVEIDQNKVAEVGPHVILEWCEDNMGEQACWTCPDGRWRWEVNLGDYMVKYYFLDEQDALLFKMRWA